MLAIYTSQSIWKIPTFLNFCDILTHWSVVFSVFKYVSPKILIVTAATCSTMYEIAFLLIENWYSNEQKDSLLTKYLRAMQHISSGLCTLAWQYPSLIKRALEVQLIFQKRLCSALHSLQTLQHPLVSALEIWHKMLHRVFFLQSMVEPTKSALGHSPFLHPRHRGEEQ